MQGRERLLAGPVGRGARGRRPELGSEIVPGGGWNDLDADGLSPPLRPSFIATSIRFGGLAWSGAIEMASLSGNAVFRLNF